MRKRYLVLAGSVILLAGCSTETPEVKTKSTNKEAPMAIDIDRKPDTQNGAPQGDASATKSPQSSKTGQSPNPSPQTTMNNKKTYATPPTMQIDTNKEYTATLKTALGDIDVKLHARETPITVNNFVFLAKEKFYDNVIFHRTIKGFMIQGGDPTGTGMGGPGYKFNDEPFTGDYKRGVVAMANSGVNTNGSQFFIMHADMALPKNYVIFGEVTKGMDVVDQIASAPTEPGGEGSKPVTPVEIRTVEITEGK